MSIASRALSNYNWSHVIDKNNCPQAAYTNFNCTLNSLVDIYFPLTTKNFNSNFHKIEPWMTVGILTSRCRKNFLFSEKLKKPNPTNIKLFKQYRNLYNSVIRTAKKNYFQSQIEANSKNLPKAWQLLYNAIRKTKNKKDSCTSLIVNGNKISDPLLMAESFNKFFATAAVEVVSKINPSNLSPTANIPNNNSLFSLKNTPVTISEILEATKLLQDKKTPDHNGISTNFL